MATSTDSVFCPEISGGHSSHRLFKYVIVTLLLLVFPGAHSAVQKFSVEKTDLNILVDETHLFKLVQVGLPDTALTVSMDVQHKDLVQFVPPTVDIPSSSTPDDVTKASYDLCVLGKSPGHTEVTFNVTPSGVFNMSSVYMRITVMHSNAIYVISYIMGWIYFVAWSVSFYPQIYTNFKRKSVVGLNFDFVSLNLMGFALYSLFNCGLFFSKAIQSEYFARHPRSLNPVQLNDVFFSLHAFCATIITIVQCIIYERDGQRVSNTGRGILAIFSLVVVVTCSMALARKIIWLDFLTYCSYIKLCITLIKYVPQAYMNYKRKSTVGWSIGNIFLDFVGGFLSILQMVLNAYNYHDWISFFGDFTKFGLGLFSLIFDIFFMLQHYVLYRKGNEFEIVESSEEGSDIVKNGVGSENLLIGTPRKRSATWTFQLERDI